MILIDPERAPVRPRVVRPASGETFLLEDEVRRWLESGGRGIITLFGLPGSGKTTALRHLAAVLPSDSVLLVDDLESSHILPSLAGRNRLVVWARRPTSPECCPAGAALAYYALAPWGQDDLIEYLLARYRPACAAVLARVPAGDRTLLGGLPELWRPVLDRLAADLTLADARRALHRHLEEHLSDTDLLERARSVCLNVVLQPGTNLVAPLEEVARPGFAQALIRLLSHDAVRQLLAAERVAADLHGDTDADYLALRLPRALVRAVGGLIAQDGAALDHLRRLLAGPCWSHAMSVSLLHATGTGWAPVPPCTTALAGAYLDEVRWPSVQLIEANLTETDLSLADLRGANLTRATAARALLSHAQLNGALLDGFQAHEADLSHADLSSTRGDSAHFADANLSSANLTGAHLPHASLEGADLTRTRFRDADLTEARLTGAELTGADFAGADLTRANLSDLPLRRACWEGACFNGARMTRCDLEEVTLFAADLENANLCGSLLTGSVLPQANFRRACLCETGLADIDWEGADLRGADLRGATFHMGSTRSGLVGSPLACEGSRTGFYTDDYDEQTYKAPEEIRKANLCGADLRGAVLEDVDFYLVDLRGACLDPQQEEHVRRCGAILSASTRGDG